MVMDLDKPLNADKGHYNGSCNRRACQKPGARFYNKGTNAYYCAECARLINDACRDMHPEGLCVIHRQQPEAFQDWDGGYSKAWYDVETPMGEVITHCWPNAGFMTATDGSGRQWAVHSGIKVRLSANHPLDEVRARPLVDERKPDRIIIDDPLAMAHEHHVSNGLEPERECSACAAGHVPGQRLPVRPAVERQETDPQKMSRRERRAYYSSMRKKKLFKGWRV